jgi:hypothetical protein
MTVSTIAGLAASVDMSDTGLAVLAVAGVLVSFVLVYRGAQNVLDFIQMRSDEEYDYQRRENAE